MKILIVEDNQEYAMWAHPMLRGHELHFAETFLEARDYLDRESFDAVLTDVYFPIEITGQVINGFRA